MILRSLFLQNFRGYETLDLSFQDGITGIVGRNGAGKSTLLEAILWCLFGVRAARTSKEGIKRQSCAVTDPCQVRLEFELNGTTYELTRSLIGKSLRSEARLAQQGSLDAVSTREVDDYIVRLIGLDMKGFLSSFFARQKELNALFDARPADRKDHLAQMLGVGRLDNAIQALKEDLKEIRQKIDFLTDLKIDPDKLSKEMADKEAEQDKSKAERAKNEKSLRQNEVDLADREKTLENLRRIEHSFNQLENKSSALSAQKSAGEKQVGHLTAELAELSGITSQLEPLKKQIEGLEEIRKRVEELKRAEMMNQEKGRLKKEKSGLAGQIADYLLTQKKTEAAVAELEKSLGGKDNLKKIVIEAEGLREKLRNEYSETKSALGITEENLAEIEKQKGEIGDLGPEATCRSCLRPFGTDYAKIEKHFDEEIRSLRQRHEPLLKRLNEIEKQGKTVSEELDRANEKMETLTADERDLASAKTSQAATGEAVNDAENRVKLIEKRLTEIGRIEYDAEKLKVLTIELTEKEKTKDEYIRLAERAARVPELEKQLTTAKNDQEIIEKGLYELMAETTALGFDREAYRKAQEDQAQIRKNGLNLRVEIERSDGRMTLLKSEIEVLAGRLTEYNKSKEEISRLRETLTYNEKLSLLFAEFRVYLIGRIRPTLSKSTSDLFYEMTDGRYQEVILDEDYSLRLFDRGESFPVNRFSGGEIDLVNLCFRLAISLEMASTAGISHSFIILDEIFGSQDSQRQQMIVEGLGRLKNRFRQIIIISHIDEVKEMAENIITVEIDNSGLSLATAIRRI